MKCLMKYEWVKLMRCRLPQGKGIMGAYTRLDSRAAFRKGQAEYCGYTNEVNAGEWSGGIVGVKSILGVKKREDAFSVLNKLSELGYISYTLDEETKKLTYKINDWVVKCSGKECMDGNVYTSQGYGFLCLPRNITERLAESGYKFEDADAWLDLWCHTVFEDPNNAFSNLAPVIQYGKNSALLTLENLGKRWGWEKTKVWRFFKKYSDTFCLYKMPGSYGCLIFNSIYPICKEIEQPTEADVKRIFDEIRILSANTHKNTDEHTHMNKIIAWYSKKVTVNNAPKNRVALFAPIIRAYISPCKNCKYCIYDCSSIYNNRPTVDLTNYSLYGGLLFDCG